MPATVSSEPFQALRASLQESGFGAQSQRLQDILSGTWTTSSELIAELGSAVLTIRRECRTLSPTQKALVKQCMKEVRKAFPGFGWLSALRFRW